MNIYQERIKPLFEKSGLTDKALEENIGLPRGIIYKWNNKKNKNYKFYIVEIAAYFNVSIDYLLGNTDNPRPAGEKEKLPTESRELIEKNERLIRWFRSLPPEKQKAILISQDGPVDLAD